MKKRILWLGLSFLLVSALVLASCGEAAPGEQEEEEEEVEEEEEEEVEEEEEEVQEGAPIYGGKLKAIFYLTDSLGSPDSAYGRGTSVFQGPCLSRLFLSDVYTYGNKPGGSGEWSFKSMEIPLKYKTGDLAESWDVTPDKVVLHIRPGVYWSGLSINPVMEKREYTAYDYVADLQRRLSPDSPSSGYFQGIGWLKEPWTEHVYTEDKYTVVLETNFFHCEWHFILTGGGGFQMAPETVAAGPDMWENLVGTGPFYVKEYVPDSYLLYGRNPYYWFKAPIGEKLWDTPFVDELLLPMILDETTAVTALRTGVVDLMYLVNAPHMASLAETNPELMIANEQGEIGWPPGITFRCDVPPFSDREVRRAMWIGTDRLAIHDMLGVPGESFGWPITRGWEGHVPFEDLPASCQELYIYDLAKAKQMLADAGYPEGFEMDAIIRKDFRLPEIAEMLADQWSKLGIVLNMEVVDGSTARRRGADKDFNDSYMGNMGLTMPVLFTHTYYATTGPRNWGVYRDEYSNSRLTAALTEVDAAKRVKMLEEAFVHMLDDAVGIAFKMGDMAGYWWPWVKNCYGEAWGSSNQQPDYQNYWIDPELKEDMGY